MKLVYKLVRTSFTSCSLLSMCFSIYFSFACQICAHVQFFGKIKTNASCLCKNKFHIIFHTAGGHLGVFWGPFWHVFFYFWGLVNIFLLNFVLIFLVFLPARERHWGIFEPTLVFIYFLTHSVHWCIAIPPENITPEDFQIFSGGLAMQYCAEMGLRTFQYFLAKLCANAFGIIFNDVFPCSWSHFGVFLRPILT